MKQVFFHIISLFLILKGAVASYQYDVQKANGHVIHVVTLSKGAYATHIIKAQNGIFGRETVAAIAERSNADIAINGGFFEIGQTQDGMPSGTLIIDGKIFGLRSMLHSCLVQHDGVLSIQRQVYAVSVTINGVTISVNHVNRQPKENEIALFTDTFGGCTLTPCHKRKEIAFDGKGNVITVSEQGNATIPKDGFVLSLPLVHTLDLKAKPTNVTLNLGQTIPDAKTSVLMGIPGLVTRGIIPTFVRQGASDFFKKPHARTAIGLKPNGDVVIVVAEHVFKKDTKKTTINDVIQFTRHHAEQIRTTYQKLPEQLTLSELKECLEAGEGSPQTVIGLTLPELAEFMISLGCEEALNLDGGGSSALWVNGKIVNQTTGDADEGEGKNVVRPVSDAVVFVCVG